MNDIESTLAALEEAGQGPLPGAVRSSADLLKEVRRFRKAQPDEVGADWETRALRLHGANLVRQAEGLREHSRAWPGKRAAKKAVRFLRRPSRKDVVLRVELAVAYNTLAWAHIELGSHGPALGATTNARDLLEAVLRDEEQVEALAASTRYQRADLIGNLGDVLYNEAGVRGAQGVLPLALRLNEQGADLLLEAAQLAPYAYEHRYSVVVDSLLRNVEAFGSRADLVRVVRKFG